MDVLIVEDEPLAAERLNILLKEYDPTVNVMARLESIEETVNWLNKKPHPDLMLLDIHLSDGHSFEIFKKANIQKPIIFTTAYENYAIDAFQLFSIDYILKPVTAEALGTAINKYKALASSFVPNDYATVLQEIKDNFTVRYKNRFLAKVGQRLFFISADEIAYFAADNKIIYVIDRKGNRFMISTTIEKLETLLDPRHFFRVNRKIIVHADVIDQIKPYPNNRLKIFLKDINKGEEIIVSRERVGEFKAWADS
jgi:DNA-binding LytR/AlgR family response regulator